MFSLSRSKLTQSTLSLTSSEEFDDCYSQMGSPPAPSPSRYNYQERVLALFIQQQRTDCCTSSSSSSSSTSPSPDNATPLGVSSCPAPLWSDIFASTKKNRNRLAGKHNRTRIYFCSEIEDDKGRILFLFFCLVVFEGPFFNFRIGWTEGGDGNHWAGVTHCSWPGSLSTYRLSTEQRKSGREERKISKQEREKKGIRPTKNTKILFLAGTIYYWTMDVTTSCCCCCCVWSTHSSTSVCL
jgi:hypothetical protein